MTARALLNGRTWMWSCPPCIDYELGFDDLEDAPAPQSTPIYDQLRKERAS